MKENKNIQLPDLVLRLEHDEVHNKFDTPL